MIISTDKHEAGKTTAPLKQTVAKRLVGKRGVGRILEFRGSPMKQRDRVDEYIWSDRGFHGFLVK